MHKFHFIGCAIGVSLALLIVAFSGGSGGSLGVLLAALTCPLAMFGAMWFLQRTNQNQHSDGHVVPPVEKARP